LLTTGKVRLRFLHASAAELTPNEYKAFSNQAPDYRLCIVRVPLGAKTLQVFMYHDAKRRWIEEMGGLLRLKIKERMSARLSTIDAI